MNVQKTLPPMDHENDWPRFVLFLLGLFFIALALGLFSWVRVHSSAQGLSNTIASMSQPSLITSIQTIARRASDKNLTGATVLLENAHVEQVLGDYIFLVKDAGNPSVPVVLLGEITGRQLESKVEVHAGDDARIFGVLLPLHDNSMIADPRWTSASDRDLLASKSFYISALRVNIL